MHPVIFNKQVAGIVMVPLTIDVPSGGGPRPHRVMDMISPNDDIMTGTDLYPVRPHPNIIPFDQHIRNMRQVYMMVEPGVYLSIVFEKCS